MEVTMQPKNELEVLTKGVEFKIKQSKNKKSRGQVFGRLSVNRRGITWYERNARIGKNFSWKKLQELSRG